MIASPVPIAPREVALPALGFTALREALFDETGPVTAVHALHAAGFRSGPEVAHHFVHEDGAAMTAIPDDAFWQGLSEHFASRGWGALTFDAIHPGVGRLCSDDWAEAEGGDERHPSCAFTTGLLSSLLTEAAGGGIAVLEITCRARGDDTCQWVFGSEMTIQVLYSSLIEGRALDDALRDL
ncbi:MAG: V4R domain-containing protein [Longimicrobiales bacterium]|nr:V4R domain-containing protein [Longimicrobiales bacterium]